MGKAGERDAGGSRRVNPKGFENTWGLVKKRRPVLDQPPFVKIYFLGATTEGGHVIESKNVA